MTGEKTASLDEVFDGATLMVFEVQPQLFKHRLENMCETKNEYHNMSMIINVV